MGTFSIERTYIVSNPSNFCTTCTGCNFKDAPGIYKGQKWMASRHVISAQDVVEDGASKVNEYKWRKGMTWRRGAVGPIKMWAFKWGRLPTQGLVLGWLSPNLIFLALSSSATQESHSFLQATDDDDSNSFRYLLGEHSGIWNLAPQKSETGTADFCKTSSFAHVR